MLLLYYRQYARLILAYYVVHRMVEEASHLSGREKRDNRVWFTAAKEELKK